jgi:hypothetical protein
MRVSDKDCNPEDSSCPLRLNAIANSAIKEFKYCRGYPRANISTNLLESQCHGGLKAKQLIISCNGWFVVVTYDRCIHVLKYETDESSVKRERKSGHKEKVHYIDDFTPPPSTFVKCEFDDPSSTNPSLLFVSAKTALKAEIFVSTVHILSLMSDQSRATELNISSTNRRFVQSGTCWGGNLWYPTDSCEGVIIR